MKGLLILAKTLEKQELNFYRSALFLMKTRVSPKYLVNDCKFLGLFKITSYSNESGFSSWIRDILRIIYPFTLL